MTRAWYLAGGLVLMVGGIFAVAKSRAPEVYVQCVPGAGGIQCSLQHKSGGGANVCWDWVSSCKNGRTIQAHACESVGESATVSHLISQDQITGMPACDALVSSSIQNIALTAL